MELYRASSYLPSLPQAGVGRRPSSHPDRVYSLAVTWLVDGSGRQRPVLGLRRHLCAQEPGHRGPSGAGEQRRLQPLVLRAGVGERLEVQVTNLLAHGLLCLALVDDDFGITEGCETPIAHGETCTYVWNCRHAGVYPVYNRACPDPMERRSLLGVLIVEP